MAQAGQLVSVGPGTCLIQHLAHRVLHFAALHARRCSCLMSVENLLLMCRSSALPHFKPFPASQQAEVEALKTAVAREKHSREAQQKKCRELEASLRRWVEWAGAGTEGLVCESFGVEEGLRACEARIAALCVASACHGSGLVLCASARCG